MKKRFITNVLFTLVMCCFIAIIPNVKTYAITRSEVSSKLDSLMSQYVGKTATSSQMLNGKQCKGFANWVFYQLFGVYIGPYPENAVYRTNTSTADVIGELAPGSLNEASCKALLQKGAPGDFIQVQRSTARGSGPHSMILVNVDGNGIEVFDANSDGKNTIKRYRLTYSQFDVANKGMSLCRAKGYIPDPVVNNPIGNIDTASGGNGTMHFTGWAFDADNSNAPLEIHIYVGGPAGSGSVQAVQGFTANLASDDVNRAYGISGNHRFDATLEVPSLVGTHMVYVYAINIGSGNHTVLFADNITVTGHNPLANYEAVEAQPGKVHVVGWTFDEDDPGKSLDVHVYIGGPAGSGAPCYPIKADKERSDVNKAFGISGNHGFDAWIDTDKTGDREIYVYPINVGGGVNACIGNKLVRIDMKSDTGQSIPDGDYHILSSLTKDKCLDIEGASNNSGANVDIYANLEDEKQVFHVQYLGDGYYKIFSKKSGKFLDVAGHSSANGTNVWMYDEIDYSAQQWIIKESGDNENYYIYSKCNGLMLDVWNAQNENGTNVQMHTPTGSRAQLWKFIAWSKDSDKTIEAGDYHIINASDKTKSLDLYEYNPANKTPIGISASATNKRQVFTLKYLGKGYYSIQHKEAESAIDIWGAYAKKGTKISGYEYNQTDAQQWIIRKSPNSPYYNIVSKLQGFCINGDTSKPDHFVDATLEIGDGSPTQDWLFIPDEDQKLKAVTKELNAALTWNALSWADTYDLNIKDASGKDFSQKGLTETSFMDQLSAGTYTASVTSRSDVYTLDSDEITFTTKRSAEDTVIEDITFEGKTYTYDGTPKSLAITQALPEGVSVKYSGNDQTDAGTYTVTAQFTDSTGKVMDVKSADLVIDPKDVSIEDSGVAVEQIPDQTYTGRETIQEPVVKDGEAVLQKDTDYTVSCEDNVNAGEATATITFKGNYSGTKSLGFHINKAANSWKSALSCQDVVYGTGLKPAAEAAFGKTTYQFAKKADGTYSDQAPATAGTWYIKALVEGTDNYTGLVSDPVEVMITKAVYDLDGLNFEDKTVTYDGEPKNHTVEGQLPLGLTVAYDGNGEAEAGTYTITAHFEGDSNNYQPVPDMTATLTIEPRPVPIPEGYNDLVYNGEEQYGVWWDSEDYTVVSGGTATEAGTHEATVRLADKKNTAWEDGTTEDKKVSWTIAGAGNEWTEALTCPDITYGQAPSPSAKAKHGTVTFTYSRDDAMTFTGKVPTEAGTYYVRARVRETEEYAGLENIMEFTIKKASYDMANVSFGDSSVDYDGRQKSITVKGDLPEGLAVSYEGNGRYNAGSYEVKAKFTGDDNHEPVPAKTATLTILPKKAEDLTFGQIADRTYSGREMEPEVDVENDYVPLTKGFDYEVEYQDNKEAGAAKAVVTMKGNYEGTKEIPFTIRQAKNKWKTELTCPDIPYGTRPEPAAEARFGKVKFIYSDQEDGDYTDTLPGRFGTWFVKATVEETSNYTGLESDPFQFAIKKHTHVWDKGEVTREPTCTEAGVRTFTCGDCGDTKTEPIAAKGHKEVIDPAVAATRTSTGLTEGSHCSVCGAVIKKQSVIPKLGNGNTGGNTGSAGNGQGGPANPSGGSNNGSGDPSGNQQAAPSDGSQGSGTQLALVEQEKTITSQKGDGDPKGSTYRILSARVKKSAGNSNTLGWKKVTGATGYIVYGNQCGAKYRFKKLAELKGTGWTHKKLKKGTYYKYVVVAVRDVSGNKTVLATSKTLHAATAGGKAGNPGMLTVKKKTITLKRNKTSVIRVSQKPLSKKQKIRKCRKVCFESDNPKIAKVTASGKVKGLKKGTCRIYVYAQNGLSKVIKVRVN